MKIVCSKQNLVNGVRIVSSAVPTRTTMSILECILIDASTDQIKLVANDMEIGIETIVEGSILDRGIVAIDAKLFQNVVSKLKDSDITITSDENYGISIDCDTSHFTVQGRAGDEFTNLPLIPKENPIEISQFSLSEVIRQTIFSISENESNKMMSGELFQIKDNQLKVASLDGHRISIRNIVLKGSYDFKEIIVPGKSLKDVQKIISSNASAEKMVDITISENHIVFSFDKTTVVSRLLDGKYFDIDKMLSSDYDTKVKINKRELLDCIDRSTLLVKEGDKKPIIMDIKDSSLELHIQSVLGSMDESIAITKEGKDLMIGFNPKFFMDALRVIDEDEITLYMVNPKAPCFIRDEEDSYIYLILPVNFNTAG